MHCVNHVQTLLGAPDVIRRCRGGQGEYLRSYRQRRNQLADAAKRFAKAMLNLWQYVRLVGNDALHRRMHQRLPDIRVFQLLGRQVEQTAHRAEVGQNRALLARFQIGVQERCADPLGLQAIDLIALQRAQRRENKGESPRPIQQGRQLEEQRLTAARAQANESVLAGQDRAECLFLFRSQRGDTELARCIRIYFIHLHPPHYPL